MTRRKHRGQVPRPTAPHISGQAAPEAVLADRFPVGQWVGRAIPWAAAGLFLLGVVQYGWIAEPTNYVGAILALILAGLSLVVARPAVNWQHWRAWALLLNAAGYALALPFSADRFQATVGVALAAIGLLAFAAGVGVGRHPGATVRLNTAVTLTTAVVCWLALAAFFGIVPLGGTVVSGRLSGTLQYPNVLGAVGLAGAVAAVGLTTPQDWLKWRHMAAYGGWLCLVLSQSRGAMFVAPFILIGLAVYSLRRWSRALLLLLYYLAAAAAAAVYLAPLLNARAGAFPQFQSFFLLSTAGVLAVGLALEWLLRRPGIGDRVTRGLVMAGAAAGLAGGMLLLPRVLPRLAQLGDTSTTVRVQHLLDAINQFVHLPLGVGYLGWRETYSQFQAWGYTINILHSWLAETAVAAGILGLAGLMGMWFAFALNYHESARRGDRENLALHATFWATTGFGIHGLLLDADFSFLVLNLAVLVIFGVYHGLAHPPGPRRRRATAAPVWWLWPAGAAVAVFLLTAAVGYNHYSRSRELADEGKGEQSLAAAKVASRWSPLDPRPRAQAGMTLLQQWQDTAREPLLEEAGAYLRSALALQPRQADRYREYARYLSAIGELSEAEQHFDRAVALAPWRVGNWEDLIAFHVRAAEALDRAGQSDAAARHRLRAREVGQQLAEQDEKRPAHVRPMKYTPALQELLQEIKSWPER